MVAYIIQLLRGEELVLISVESLNPLGIEKRKNNEPVNLKATIHSVAHSHFSWFLVCAFSGDDLM